MHEPFEIIPFLHRATESSHNGRVHILGKDAEWCLDIVDGKVLFAAHSLQYLITLESILSSLGYGAVLPVYWRLTQHRHQPSSDDRGLEALNWTSKVVGALVKHNTLTLKQAEEILAKLAEDAVESLLGLESATVTWHPIPQGLWHVATNGLHVSALVPHLSARLRAWQPVCDRIYSPYQRPYCENTDDLYQSVPQGLLSQQMLAALARLMQGATIRQLAQSVKQDEAKLAKLLYPYIQHRVIKLWPPVQPLDRLPWLPGAKLPASAPATIHTTPQSANRKLASNTYPANNYTAANSGLVTNTPKSAVNKLEANNRPSSPNGLATKQSGSEQLTTRGLANRSSAESRYLIICIDDSQAMLEQIDSYLDPERFELKTVMDPVASVSKICAMKPDLVLMDISMPSINGNSFCQILKRSYMFKDVPIIMISGNASPLNKATAQSSGATDYLEKPFSKTQLMQVLNTYLETSPIRSS